MVGSNVRLAREKIGKDKHSSLLQSIVSDEEKNVYDFDARPERFSPSQIYSRYQSYKKFVLSDVLIQVSYSQHFIFFVTYK
jgi:hypothetical protein